jgi:hypothetical protein
MAPASDLSPAAQAVKDAVLAIYPDKATSDIGWPIDVPAIAAALRAAADQMTNYPSKKFLFSIADEMKLLAIAAELETFATETDD